MSKNKSITNIDRVEYGLAFLHAYTCTKDIRIAIQEYQVAKDGKASNAPDLIELSSDTFELLCDIATDSLHAIHAAPDSDEFTLVQWDTLFASLNQPSEQASICGIARDHFYAETGQLSAL